MEQSGKTLSMHSNAIWKGDYSHNGTLLKIHENAYTIGYSKLLKADGTAGANVKFGDVVFYDWAKKNNNVFAGSPTGDGADPVVAGVVVREPAIASGYPVNNSELAPFQKGKIAKQGYVIYKKLYNTKAKAVADAGDEVEVNTILTGTGALPKYVRFATVNGKPYLPAADDTAEASGLVGEIVSVNPDDGSITVFVSPLHS